MEILSAHNGYSGGYNRSHKYIIIGAGLLVVLIIAIVLFFTHGTTVTTGTYPAPVSTDALSCESATASYPFFTSGSPTATSIKVNIALGQSEIESISIIVSSEYESENAATIARDKNRAAMNSAFDKANLNADALGAVYSRKNNIFNFNLYANSKDLNSATYQFFLLGNNPKPALDALSKIYNDQGFNCLANH